jgi:hypothetical protein
VHDSRNHVFSPVAYFAAIAISTNVYSKLYISYCNFLGIPVFYHFCQCIELSSYLTFFYKNFMQRFSPIPTFVHVDSHVIGD